MSLHATFFGRFELTYGEDALISPKSHKALEILAYLLLNREAARDVVASLVWGETASTGQARKYLRNSIWQIHSQLENQIADSTPLLVADSRSIWINPSFMLTTDVEEFEKGYTEVKGVHGIDLNPDQAKALERIVGLHTDDFLTGWFSEWCIAYREHTLLELNQMLDKLVDYSLYNGDYEIGLLYAERILSYDRASESTHRKIMEMEYRMGHRTLALRQYEACEAALREELDVDPSGLTRDLYEAIRNDNLGE